MGIELPPPYYQNPAPASLTDKTGIDSSNVPVTDNPVSISQQAAMGANTPGQSSLTQNGLMVSANPLFRAMNQQTLTQITALSDGNVGTFLQSRGRVNGNTASIINATLDYISGGKSQSLPPVPANIKNSNTKRTFIPIILKTDFNYNTISKTYSDTNLNTNTVKQVPVPLYIIFDSTPEDITFSKSANWNPINFLGRPEPVFTYQYSSPITFSLTGKFYAESVTAHGRLLKLSDYIMSLATPSEKNYMPSPVTVFIGQWKELHCIVTQVSIKYSGPWSIQINSSDVDNAPEHEQNALNAALIGQQQAPTTIPSHAPYLFEATFAFTVVGQDNKVQYAEQVIADGFNNNSAPLTSDDTQKEALQNTFPVTNSYETINTGLYGLDVNKQYILDKGRITLSTNSQLSYSTSGNNYNIYGNANAVNRLADQGVITNAISSQMLTLFQKANPTSTRTPETTTSLNPFKKLF